MTETQTEVPMISTNEASRRMGITVRTLYRFINEGMITGYRIGRNIRLKESDIDAYLETARIEAGSLGHLHGNFTRKAPPPKPADETG